MTPSPAIPAKEQRYREIRKITLVGAVVNSFLAAGKIILGVIGQSQALIADGVHSLADLFSDVIVIYAAKHASREADDDHPYGHGRIETIASVALGVFLIFVAAGICYDAALRIINNENLLSPGWLALTAATVSILANEALYQYTIRGARKNNSSLLHANAWHHRSDAVSSIIALIGIGGTMAGWQFMDAVAAFGVSLMICKVGWDIGWKSMLELLDTALDSDTLQEIEQKILQVHGVEAVHSLRTRSHGGQALVDVHILINNPHASVSEGHRIAEVVQQNLLNEVDVVTDVTVHIDPEDDEAAAPNIGLPLRDEVERRLRDLWAEIPAAGHIQNITLHFLDGKIDVTVVIPVEFASSREKADLIQQSLADSLQQDTRFRKVTTYFS